MSQKCGGARPDIHRTQARRNPGVWDCAATGVPRAREGPRILDPSTPHVLKLWDISASATMSRKVSFQMLLTKRKSLYDYMENHKHWLTIFNRRRSLQLSKSYGG